MPNETHRLMAALCDLDPKARASAAEQLAGIGRDAQPAAVALVLAAGDESEEVRQWATAALEQLGPPEEADLSSLAALVDGRTADVGYWAATLIGRLKGQAAGVAETLARSLAGSPHLSVRQRAAWALGEIGPGACAALPSLHKAAQQPDARLSRLAQQAIAQIAGGD